MSSILFAAVIAVCSAQGECKPKTVAINMNSLECSEHMIRTVAAFQSQGIRTIRKAGCVDQPAGVMLKFAD